VKSGTVIGFDNLWPVNTVFMSPLKSKMKLLYMPSFNPVMVNCPVAVEVMVAGPIGAPSSL